MAQWDSMLSVQRQVAGLIPSPEHWVKDLVLLQLRCKWQQWLRSDIWPGSSLCYGVAKKQGEKSLLPEMNLDILF